MTENINSPRIVLQPHLGRMENNYKPQDNIGGYLALAKVTKVHHKHSTVDLQIVKTNDSITSSELKEGRFGARLSVASAHFDKELLSSSGVIEPIQEGQLVILAFLDGVKDEPIILGSFHETWEMGHNVLVGTYPVDPRRSTHDLREANKYLRVTPSQYYHRIDGIGAVETSHPSRSFSITDPDHDELIGDGHGQFDHNDLSEKDPYTNLVRSARIEEALRPVKILKVHRSDFDDETTTWSKFFLDRTGAWRTTRDNNDGTLSYAEMTSGGEYKYRRQLDSNIHGEGERYLELKIKDEDAEFSIERKNTYQATKLTVDKEGSVELSRKNDDQVTRVSITENGSIEIERKDGRSSTVVIDEHNNMTLQHQSGSYMKMDGSGDIIVNANRFIHMYEGGG